MNKPMSMALSFIGPLPSYVVDCVYQARLFFDGDIYVIYNDTSSQYLAQLEKYNAILINSATLDVSEFNKIARNNWHKFFILTQMKGREELFVRSFERFFLIQELMKGKNIENVLFIELDNLIYDNPRNWVDEFSKHELCFMYDNTKRCSSGIMFIKTHNSLDTFSSMILDKIQNSNEFMDEMSTLWKLLHTSDQNIQMLPVFWPDSSISHLAYDHFGKYGNSLFDAAGMGIWLGGHDPHNTSWVVKKNPQTKWSEMDYRIQSYKWEKDEQDRNIPYILYNDTWLRINNLHITSKTLNEFVSKPY